MSLNSGSRTPFAAPPSLRPDPNASQCHLLGPAALIVQALMGVLVISSLIAKRQMERKKRKWRVWLWDVAKQLVGQAVVHGLNLLISDVVANSANNNPCSLYFLNVALDTTLGVGIFFCGLKGYTWALNRCGIDGLQSGFYGDPPQAAYWWRQLAPYLMSIVTMKLLVILPLTLPRVSAWLIQSVQYLLSHLPPDAQVVVVLAIFPLIMNVFQFCIVDQIVKAGKGHDVDHDTTGDVHDAPGDREREYRALPSHDNDLESGHGHSDLRRRNSSARDLRSSLDVPGSPLLSPTPDTLKPDYGSTSPRYDSLRVRRGSSFRSLRSPSSSITLALEKERERERGGTEGLGLEIEDGKGSGSSRDVRSMAPSPDSATQSSLMSSRVGDLARDARRELSPPRERNVGSGGMSLDVRR